MFTCLWKEILYALTDILYFYKYYQFISGISFKIPISALLQTTQLINSLKTTFAVVFYTKNQVHSEKVKQLLKVKTIFL